MNDIDPEPEIATIECNDCGKWFFEDIGLQSHLCDPHVSTIECNECGKVFFEDLGYAKHDCNPAAARRIALDLINEREGEIKRLDGENKKLRKANAILAQFAIKHGGLEAITEALETGLFVGSSSWEEFTD